MTSETTTNLYMRRSRRSTREMPHLGEWVTQRSSSSPLWYLIISKIDVSLIPLYLYPQISPDHNPIISPPRYSPRYPQNIPKRLPILERIPVFFHLPQETPQHKASFAPPTQLLSQPRQQRQQVHSRLLDQIVQQIGKNHGDMGTTWDIRCNLPIPTI